MLYEAMQDTDFWGHFSEELIGIDVTEIVDLVREILDDPESGLTDKQKRELKDLADQAQNAANRDAAKDIIKKIGKFLEEFSKSSLGKEKLPKTIGKILGKATKWVPIIGDIVFSYLDAREAQGEAKELAANLQGIDKWQLIERGLGRYDTGTTQESWNKTYNDRMQNLEEEHSDDSPLYRLLHKGRAEEKAKNKADGHVRSNVASNTGGVEEGKKPSKEDTTSACYYFWEASQIHPLKIPKKILSYDPERVEVEDPLMHGEPYPEII
jgi:hypothetical protein